MNDAFLSIVAHTDSPDHLLVRARRVGDIEAVFPDAKVEHTPAADYAYRTMLSRGEVAVVMARRLCTIDYPNFKNSVNDPQRHDAYFDVWRTLLSLGRRRPQPAAWGDDDGWDEVAYREAEH